MNKTLNRWAVVAAGAVGLLASSCAYDPYYQDSFGYSGSSYSGGGYSTSLFISTGNSRWGYDPYCHSYYDYTRRAYYDPFLYGYYPVGYRPPVIYGAPHPHGWRPGSRYCPPPSRITGRTLTNYRDREGSYRRANFSWSGQVRQRDQGSNFQPRQSFNGDRERQTGSYRRESGERMRTESRPDFRSESPPRVEMRGNESGRSRGFDRQQFENRMNQRNSESRSPSPQFNRPINVPQERQAPQRFEPQRQAPQRIEPQRQAPQFDRSAMRQNMERSSPPSRSSSQERSRGRSSDDGGRQDRSRR